MKLYPLLFLAVFAIGVASAQVSIVNDVNFNLDNNAYLKVLAPQTSTNITIYNSTNSPASTLQFYINGTPIRFTADTNKTLSNISYNNVADVVTYTGNGTTGNLNVTARMGLSLAFYNLNVDGNTSQAVQSDASGIVSFNYTGWSPNQREFEILRVRRGVKLTNISVLSQATDAGTNATYILNLTNNGTAFDSYNLTVDSNGASTAYINISPTVPLDNGASIIFSLNVSNIAAGIFNVNVTARSNNDTTKFAYINTTTTVSIPPYMPPSPVNIASNTGNFWVNTTWEAGASNITNSYNVSINGAWTNGSATAYANSTLSPHSWHNVSVYAWNSSGTGTLNNTPATNNTRIPNNIPVLSPIGSKTVDENQTLSFTITATDADGDTLTNGTNATKGSFTAATGTFTWTPTFGESGTYVWYFNSTDNYSAVASETITVTVTNVPLTLTSRSPDTDPATIVGTAQAFNVTLNRTANVTWYLNATSFQTNTSVTSASYTNSTAGTGIYNVTALVSDTFDTTGSMWNWTVNPVATYLPPTPVILTATTGNFWINTTWEAGAGNVTNSYNVSVNGAWTNGTTNTYANSTLSSHSWHNVSVYAWNSSGTGTLNATPASANTQIANNPVTISNVSSSYALIAGDTLSIYPTSSDPDGDTPTFARNFTNGTFYTNNGTLLWTTTSSDAGIYSWQINVTDGYGSVSSKNFVVTVTVGAPSITSFSPSSPVSDIAGATRTFNITVNQTVNVTWYINGTTVFNQTIVTESSYTNTSVSPGTWNVTTVANNANGTISREWIWNVTAAPAGAPSITSFSPSSTVSNTTGATRTFNITVNQPVNVTWYINGTPVQTNPSITESNYTNTSAVVGTWNVTAVANNANGTVSQQWIWNITATLAGGPNINSFVPSSPVSNIAGSSRNFKIIVNQTVNVTWYINSTTVFNQTNITESSYTNTSAASGTWNVTAVANNANGAVSQQWIWIVTAESVQPPALPAPTPAPVGGGGGGAGVISPEPLINIEQYEIMEEYLGANVPASYILTTPGIVISEVLITPAKNFGITSIRVELLKDLSNIEGITQPLGIVYKYTNIWVGSKELEGEEGIIDAFIGFRVETSWLVGSNLEDNSVKLLRWDGSKWVSLETVPKNRDDNFVYYESKTPGFSPFVIVAVPLVPSATVEMVETSTIDTAIQKIVKQIGEPGLSRWVYIFIALVLGGLLVYSLIKIKNAIKANQTIAGVLKSDSLIKIKRAMRFYDEAEKIKPENETIWYNKGIALYESGDYEEAIKAYDKAIEINPEYADAWNNKGFALYELEKYDDALKAYDKAREIIHTSRRHD